MRRTLSDECDGRKDELTGNSESFEDILPLFEVCTKKTQVPNLGKEGG